MTTAVDALQRTLAAEHAAVFWYGVLGGRTSQARTPALAAALTAAYAEHRARRDELVATLRELLVEPAAAEPGYLVPPSPTPARTARLALELERAGAETYAAQVADTTDAPRLWAMRALAAAAVRALDFGGGAETWPGVPEL